MTFNVSFIHKNLALRWLYVTNDFHDTSIKEYTLKSDIDSIVDELIAEKVDAIGLSVYIFNHEKSKQFIKQLKNKAPFIQVIVGGPEPTYQVKDWLAAGADAVVLGEGEFAFWDAVNQKQHVGVATTTHMDAVVLSADLQQLEQVRNPYFLDVDAHDEANRYLYLEASRGCPFSCTYCMSGIEHGVRYFSMDYIKNIINQIENSKVKTIKFLDRTFNVHPQRALKIIRLLNNMKKKVSIQLELEVSIWDQSLQDFFIQEGKRDRFRFEIGVQTFNKSTLEAVKRKQDNHMVKHVITSLSKAGYVVHADLIAGLPYENAQQFIDSFHELFVVAPLEIQLGILKGLPGTLLFLQSKALGMHFDPSPPYIILETPWMSHSELKMMELAALGVEKTYNRPLGKILSQTIFKTNHEVFPYFYQVGKLISQLKHPYQLSDIIQCMVIASTPYLSSEVILGAIGTDMGRWSKQKPKGLPFVEHDNHVIQAIIFDIDMRNHNPQSKWKSNYWVYPALVDNQVGYQCIVYPLNKRYYYTKGAQYVAEENHFTS